MSAAPRTAAQRQQRALGSCQVIDTRSFHGDDGAEYQVVRTVWACVGAADMEVAVAPLVGADSGPYQLQADRVFGVDGANSLRVRPLAPGRVRLVRSMSGKRTEAGETHESSLRQSFTFNVPAPTVLEPRVVRPGKTLVFEKNGGPALGLGGDGYGVVFRPELAHYPLAGKFGFVQTCRLSMKFTDWHGQCVEIGSAGQYCLDRKVPYASTTTKTVDTVEPFANDAPWLGLHPAWQLVEVDDQFSMYLAFRASGQQAWVTFARADWAWKAKASRSGIGAKWQAQDLTPPRVLSFVETNEQPRYTGNSDAFMKRWREQWEDKPKPEGKAEGKSDGSSQPKGATS